MGVEVRQLKQECGYDVRGGGDVQRVGAAHVALVLREQAAGGHWVYVVDADEANGLLSDGMLLETVEQAEVRHKGQAAAQTGIEQELGVEVPNP